MKKILIILNAIVYNRGSEALIRGISKIIKEEDTNTEITLVSSEENFGDWLNFENIDIYQKKINYSNNSLMRYLVPILKKIRLDKLAVRLQYSKLKRIAVHQDIILVIGADNYDISYNMQNKLNELHTYLRMHTKSKMILYDCSISEKDITETLKIDLENFDIVTVRETISEENLKPIISDKLHLYPDPAFIMDSQEMELPSIFDKNGVIGVNISNLITNPKYGSQTEIILKAYKKMMNYILENTQKNICLIPHVMKDADLSTLRKLYADYEDNKRVFLLAKEELNAKQLKYIISKCDLFIGARTHATIAAYSTVVPTLVLGYSVKSKGIAKDIFGTYKNYVLPVADLNSEDYLVNGFKWLYNNQTDIRNILKEKMPKYIDDIRKTTQILKKD